MNAPADAAGVDAIRARLAPASRARLGALEIVSSIDSTNAELLRRGAAQPDNAVLVADAQQAGRGRRGRGWHSPPRANLYLSLYRRSARPVRELTGLGLAVGVACAEALHRLGADAVRLKWPNDLLAQGRKLGGILVELAPGAAVIGIGLNLAMPPRQDGAIGQPWIDLHALGVDATRADVVVALLDALLPALDQYEGAGFDPFRPRWEALDAYAGAMLHLIDGEERRVGRSLGLAPDGGLRVECNGIERVFRSADVSLRRS